MGDLVLVTGGAGYVGSHLTRKLLARGHRVRVLDNFVYGNHGLEEVMDHPDLELQTGDICDDRDADARDQGRARRRCAGRHRRRRGVRSRSESHDGDQLRVDAPDCSRPAAPPSVERLVFASSCSVYGANGNEFMHERSHLNPVSLYARTRIMSEEILLISSGRGRDHPAPRDRLRRLAAHALRPHGQHDDRLRHRAGRDPRQRRQAVAPARARAGCRRGVPRRRRGGDDAREDFNVGSDEQNFTVGEVAEHVAEHYPGTQHRVRAERARPAQLPRRVRSHPRDARVPRAEDRRRRHLRGRRPGLPSGACADFRHEQFHNAKWLSATGACREPREVASAAARRTDRLRAHRPRAPRLSARASTG